MTGCERKGENSGLLLWQKSQRLSCFQPELGVGIDVSRMEFDPTDQKYQPQVKRALRDMEALEKGAVANPDEGRMVGHYWLRASELAPNVQLRDEIDATRDLVAEYVSQIQQGEITSSQGKRFTDALIIGIGGSALGPQLLYDALGRVPDRLRLHFFDNTDPNGMARTLAGIPDLGTTLGVVISKSGGTKETRNGQLVAQAAWRRAGLNPAQHFIAVTGLGSKLDQLAAKEGWLRCLPMWDWVGGRTSLWSAVGLLPAGLQGINTTKLLEGAAVMDKATRRPEVLSNPALLLALGWLAAGKGRGEKAMVVLPYCDRLELFSRYLQQLVMESLGKEKDLDGQTVHQGLTVFGNKGSTDQHAYVQQLRDGLDNFFVTFIEVLADNFIEDEDSLIAAELEVEPGVTSGDYLSGFYQGTRRALYESGRRSLTITIDQLSERSLGALLALFERAVGFYASFVNINAYHQPGVEAGKRAAGEVITLQQELMSFLSKNGGAFTAEEVAVNIGRSDEVETVFRILRHLAANRRLTSEAGENVFKNRYTWHFSK